MFELSTTRGAPGWGWGAVLQPVLEYTLLAFALLVFFVAWLRWFYPRARHEDVEAQVIQTGSSEPVQQSTSYGSVSTAQRASPSPKPLHAKRKHKTLAHHAHTVPPAKVPSRSGTSGLNNLFGRVLPLKTDTHPRAATQYTPTENGHDAQLGPNRIWLTDETHDEPQSFYSNQPPTPTQTHYPSASSSRRTRGHTGSLHPDHVQTLPPPQLQPIRTTTISTYAIHPQVESPVEDDIAYAEVDRAWEREHCTGHGAGRSSSGSEGDDDLIDAGLQEGPAKQYRTRAREEARYRRAAFEASKKAYRANRKAEAKQLSDQGKMHDENVRRYNSMAAAEIFRLNNPRYNTTQRYSRCDLHGLHIEEAKHYAEGHIKICYQAGVEKTMLIVGKGAHSHRGSARIKPAILEMLRGRPGILAGTHEKNEGCIVIEFVRHHHHHGTRGTR